MREKHDGKIGVLLLYFLCLVAPSCRRAPEPPASVDLSGKQSINSSFWVTNWGFYLRPIDSDANSTEKREEVIRRWDNLFSGMAEDSQTKELLTRLYNGWPTEIIGVDPSKGTDKAALATPPPDGIAVVFRVVDLNKKEVETSVGVVPFREIAFGHVVQVKDAAKRIAIPSIAGEPAPGEALEIAIEEYVMRKAPGWIARRGTGPTTVFDSDVELRKAAEDAVLPSTVHDQLQELEHRIEAFSDQAKSYFGSPSGKE